MEALMTDQSETGAYVLMCCVVEAQKKTRWRLIAENCFALFFLANHKLFFCMVY